MLEITPKAIQEFKETLKTNAGKTIRIFSIPGGCCGPTLGMAMVDQGEAGDETITSDGLVVFLEKQAAAAFNGVTIDFSDAPGRKGFLVKKPAGSECCS